jgi:hypothetical protein
MDRRSFDWGYFSKCQRVALFFKALYKFFIEYPIERIIYIYKQQARISFYDKYGWPSELTSPEEYQDSPSKEQESL